MDTFNKLIDACHDHLTMFAINVVNMTEACFLDSNPDAKVLAKETFVRFVSVQNVGGQTQVRISSHLITSFLLFPFPSSDISRHPFRLLSILWFILSICHPRHWRNLSLHHSASQDYPGCRYDVFRTHPSSSDMTSRCSYPWRTISTRLFVGMCRPSRGR
jgi:hypothetical protein